MSFMRHARGHTLVELVFVLMLFGVTGAWLAPTARRYRDRAAVVAAREAVVGLLADARAAALEHGAGSLRVTADPPVASLAVADSTVGTVALEREFGVSMTFSGGGASVELRYDALGLGRFASQTLGFQRGLAAAELVVSSYGRVRRR